MRQDQEETERKHTTRGKALGKRVKKKPRLAPAIDEPPLLYTRAQAARLLNCSVGSIIRLQRSGKLPGIRLAGRSGQVYFRRDDLFALLEDAADAQD